jgi:hypothetical protein
LVIVPTLKPAALTSSLSVAASPGTVVPFSTATVTLEGFTPPPLGSLRSPVPSSELSPPAAVCRWPLSPASSSPVSCVTP